MNWYGFQSVQKVLTAHPWVWSGPEVVFTFVKLNCSEISVTDCCENLWPVNRTSEKNMKLSARWFQLLEIQIYFAHSETLCFCFLFSSDLHKAVDLWKIS